MANELTLVWRKSNPIPFTVADGTGIEKGALCKLTDPMTAALSATNYDVIAGVAASEKIASDGKTKLGMFRDGIFKATASGSITVGDGVVSLADANFPNYVGTAKGQNAASGAACIGTALETVSASETFLFELNIGAGPAGGAAV